MSNTDISLHSNRVLRSYFGILTEWIEQDRESEWVLSHMLRHEQSTHLPVYQKKNAQNKRIYTSPTQATQNENKNKKYWTEWSHIHIEFIWRNNVKLKSYILWKATAECRTRRIYFSIFCGSVNTTKSPCVSVVSFFTISLSLFLLSFLCGDFLAPFNSSFHSI